MRQGILLLVLLIGLLHADAYEIGEAMEAAAFWKSDPGLFLHKHQEEAGFKFTNEDRTAADSRREGGVTYFGIPVYETRLTFGGKVGIVHVELTLFTRGGTEGLDEINLGGGQTLRRVKSVKKNMTKEAFYKTLDDVRAALTPKGKKPPKIERQSMKDMSIRQCVQRWSGTDAAGAATLTWNYTVDDNKKFAASGFIRLVVEGPEGAEKTGTAKTPTSMRAKKAGDAKLTDNIARDSRGDVFIDNVPMVDQGQKGYCAVATSERVLRYYGVNVDEHQLAVMAETRVEGGTSTSAMIASVDAVCKKHNLAMSTLYGDADKGVEERIANLGKEVRQYNKAAKKLKKPQITDDMYITRSGNMISYDPAAVDAAKDVEVLRELKVNGVEKPKYNQFMKNIRKYVNEGKPLIWGVTLGMYSEGDLPQSRGGHMRLIIGYNDKKGDVIYSDSWGKGHEKKRMPADWAWTITHCLLGLRPLK